ncbi:MAG TPA: hypothetical protein VE338_00355 [Ktedonobacterales bacterium]|jgi:hypothetical protein|nr:hypothetical protein [Ktedonobacterales bacterium]
MLRRILRKPQAPAQAPARAAEIAENVKSLRAIPTHELPDRDARAALIALAESGHEVYAYTPVGYTSHIIWIRPEWPDQDGRLSPVEWMTRYRASIVDGTLDALDMQGGQPR